MRLRQNDPATALKLLKSALKRAPRNGEILLNLGAAHRINGEAAHAVEALRKAVKLNPRNGAALLNPGNAAVDAGEPEIAIDAYHQLVALQPDHLEARKSLARLYQENSEAALAHSEFEFICERDRTDADPYNRLGVLIAESGDHKSAVEKLTIAASLAPTDPEIRCNLGNALSRVGNRDTAAQQYRTVIASHPNHADAHASLANNLLANGKYTEGWALFCDCAFLWLADISELLALTDDRYAAMCVHHDHRPTERRKMDGREQTVYPRKNWSSLILFNCGHEANAVLTPDLANRETGKYLHRFGWLDDALIGEIPERWNWLEGWNELPEHGTPAAIHYTRGGPWFDDWKDVDYAYLWLEEEALYRAR